MEVKHTMEECNECTMEVKRAMEMKRTMEECNELNEVEVVDHCGLSYRPL